MFFLSVKNDYPFYFKNLSVASTGHFTFFVRDSRQFLGGLFTDERLGVVNMASERGECLRLSNQVRAREVDTGGSDEHSNPVPQC